MQQNLLSYKCTNMEEIIKKLTELSKTIATMESCTGGAVANSITNIEGASLVFKFGAVTYSNEYKIKMGVDSNIIDKYTVYSIETAMEMSKNIAEFSNADYGIGITGKINREDQNNMFGDNSKIFILYSTLFIISLLQNPYINVIVFLFFIYSFSAAYFKPQS